MGLTVRYVAPKIDARALVATGAAIGVYTAGKALLAASLPQVPRDTDALHDSGEVLREGPHKVRVQYTAESEDGYAYGIKQHEDATLNHPNGGNDHFLSKPASTEGDAMLDGMAAGLRAVL